MEHTVLVGDINIVKFTQWINFEQWLQQVEFSPSHYSPWCVEESNILRDSQLFDKWFTTKTNDCVE